ncbi:hypothetical protein U2063_15435, partial [Listeria monocytogenes]|uniref:hypothetical protein n=1 Tax=Listeria monocytogenes TaxID=1639 RepID=UPI002FDC3D7D
THDRIPGFSSLIAGQNIWNDQKILFVNAEMLMAQMLSDASLKLKIQRALKEFGLKLDLQRSCKALKQMIMFSCFTTGSVLFMVA